ncbi:hypothetical protein AOQ84DRAFT_373310 [Glonium stellatum]|uniref:Uncharacterized protein n=1 Tax=Glonium stellatum TaxID=574774 RepID=A0A8E2F7U3_9PEZI|nr:hypothetical protein AOQ84DRAFT_373310 [Glonium stellatum]
MDKQPPIRRVDSGAHFIIKSTTMSTINTSQSWKTEISSDSGPFYRPNSWIIIEDCWHAFKKQFAGLEAMNRRLMTQGLDADKRRPHLLEAANAPLRQMSWREAILDDDYVITAWKKLRWLIKDWAVQNSNLAERPPSYSRRLRRLTRNPDAYRQSNKDRHLLIQAYLWHALNDYVFNSFNNGDFGQYWANNELNLRELRKMLQPSLDAEDAELKQYHMWRAKAAQLISQKTGPATVQEGTGSLHWLSMVYRDLEQITKPLADSKSMLLKIFEKAVQLDAELNRQRAFFYPGWCNENGSQYGFDLDSSSMEKVDGGKSGSVTLNFAARWLVKYQKRKGDF